VNGKSSDTFEVMCKQVSAFAFALSYTDSCNTVLDCAIYIYIYIYIYGSFIFFLLYAWSSEENCLNWLLLLLLLYCCCCCCCYGWSRIIVRVQAIEYSDSNVFWQVDRWSVWFVPPATPRRLHRNRSRPIPIHKNEHDMAWQYASETSLIIYILV